jgi:hypothetical protein
VNIADAVIARRRPGRRPSTAAAVNIAEAAIADVILVELDHQLGAVAARPNSPMSCSWSNSTTNSRSLSRPELPDVVLLPRGACGGTCYTAISRPGGRRAEIALRGRLP